MQVNTMCYQEKSLDWLGSYKNKNGKKFSAAHQLVFRILVSCIEETKTFSVMTKESIKMKTGISIRTIDRGFDYLVDNGFARVSQHWFDGMLMDSLEFLAHPYVVAWYARREKMQRKKNGTRRKREPFYDHDGTTAFHGGPIRGAGPVCSSQKVCRKLSQQSREEESERAASLAISGRNSTEATTASRGDIERPAIAGREGDHQYSDNGSVSEHRPELRGGASVRGPVHTGLREEPCDSGLMEKDQIAFKGSAQKFHGHPREPEKQGRNQDQSGENSGRTDRPDKEAPCLLVSDTSSPGGYASVLCSEVFSLLSPREDARPCKTTCELQESAKLNGQIADNLSSRLTIESKNKSTPPLPPIGGKAADAAKESCEPWDTALNRLHEIIPAQDFKLWIKPIQATETEAGLRLDCLDRFHLAGVQERFGTDIHDAIQLTENTEFYFSFGEQEKELQEGKEAEAKLRARQMETNKFRELESLSAEEQFSALVAEYPVHRRAGRHPAMRIFRRLVRRGETTATELLQILSRQKVSDLWLKDQGQWVPGIKKWLGERRWEESVQ